MAVSDEIKEQTKKLKEMTFDQKADYIYTYYKWWILGALAVIFVIISTAKAVINNSKPVFLYATFLNSTAESRGTSCTLDDEFIASENIDISKYGCEFDYVTYLDNDYSNQQSMGGQVKIMSRYSVEQLDILCGPESVLNGSADVGGYTNLSEVLPDGMLDELISKGYEPYYYTEKVYADDAECDADGNMPYTEGEKYIGGIYINNCKMLCGTDSTCVYDSEMPEKMVLAIAWNAPNLENAIEFIRFVTQ